MTVRAAREHGRLVLEVADDGAGMAPERPGGALAEGRIGLATCRERMEAVGGSFDVRSAPGSGTRVCSQAPAPGPGGAPRTSGLDDGRDGA